MRSFWMFLLMTACAPTLIVSITPSDGGTEVSFVVDAARVDAGADVPVVLDVPVLLDVSNVDRAMGLDRVPIVDRPASPDVVQPRDIVLVSDTPPSWPFGLRPGDRIKARSSSTIYVFGSSGRRHLFFNEAVYYSWYLNQVGVIELADRDLASIQPGPNVTVRPGTWLIKIQTAPQTYAVTRCGVRRWITTESLGRRLFGPMWNTGSDQSIPVPGIRRTRDLPVTIFAEYQEGATITTAVHPDGSLIRYAGGAERYLVQNGVRRRITQEGFVANRFNEAFLTETDIAYPDGAPITGYEATLSDPVPCTP